MTSKDKNTLLNILIAEDERNIGDLLTELLAQEDRNISLVYNGLEAVEKLKEEKFDLLITDLMMPEVDGMEVLHEAKRLNADIMVIIITGYASLETAIQAVKEGAYDYLRKPFRLEELKISVDNACEKILLRRENELLLNHIREMCRIGNEEGADGDGSDHKPQGRKRLFGPDWFPPNYFDTAGVDKRAVIDELERLARLKSQGAITNEEFVILKKKLFDNF